MLYKEDLNAIKERAAKAYETWPDFYYELENPEERKKLLEQAIADSVDVENNQKRLDIWERRYAARSKKEMAGDRYIKGWLTMFSIARAGETFLNRKTNAKNLREALDDLYILEYASDEEAMQQLITAEWKHFTEMYFRLCAESKEYTSYVLGIGKMKDDALIRKMSNEIYLIRTKVPKMAGIKEEELMPFLYVVMDAFSETFVGARDELVRLKLLD